MKNLCKVEGWGDNFYFLNNLLQYQNNWYCEVLDLDLAPIKDNVQIVEFELVSFLDFSPEENRLRKEWLIKLCPEMKPEVIKEQIRKIKNRRVK